MRAAFFCAVAAAATLAASAANAASPVCTREALGARVRLPALGLACRDETTQKCSTDSPETLLDDPSCNGTVAAYAKRLARVLTPVWWNTKSDLLESCRIRGKAGKLTDDEAQALELGYGAEIQGDDRVRMLVFGGVCGTGGISNVLLVVRSDRGPVTTPLFFAFNQGGEEAPFSLDIARNGTDTFAIFTASGHDASDAFAGSLVYKIDFKTGAATLYPLYKTGAGDEAIFSTSEPIGAELDESGTAQIRDGHFVQHFFAYNSNFCDPDAKKCAPVRKTGFTFKGSQFVVDNYGAARADFLRSLAAQRACLQSHFDTKEGTAACAIDAPCEGNNDLSLLSFKAKLFDRAKNYASDALESCRGRMAESAAAEFNYRRAAKAAH